MTDKKAKKTRSDPAARQLRVYRVFIIILSAVVVLSMVLQMISK